jgi:hypothetical protein
MSDAAIVCKANINAAGRRKRVQMGFATGVFSVALLGYFVAGHAAMGTRALVGLPAMMSAAGFLQVRRNTCVALAATGQREGEQGLEKAPDDEVSASRVVSRGIYRDILLTGLAAAAVGAATALLV